MFYARLLLVVVCLSGYLAANGGIQSTVGYPLINGRHACGHAGLSISSWNFDAKETLNKVSPFHRNIE